jgi:hypothetical protein
LLKKERVFALITLIVVLLLVSALPLDADAQVVQSVSARPSSTSCNETFTSPCSPHFPQTATINFRPTTSGNTLLLLAYRSVVSSSSAMQCMDNLGQNWINNTPDPGIGAFAPSSGAVTGGITSVICSSSDSYYPLMLQFYELSGVAKNYSTGEYPWDAAMYYDTGSHAFSCPVSDQYGPPNGVGASGTLTLCAVALYQNVSIYPMSAYSPPLLTLTVIGGICRAQ